MPRGEYKDFEFGPMSLCEEEIINPHKIIDDFFQVVSLEVYRQYIFTVLEAANSNHCWADHEPATVLELHENLKRLIETVFILNSDAKNLRRNESLIKDEGVMASSPIEASLFVGVYVKLPYWDSFPRFLSEKEFCNPYTVFPKFFQFKNLPEWRDLLCEIFFYALKTQPAGFEIDYLGVYIQLLKLIEATHLIFVREILVDKKSA